MIKQEKYINWLYHVPGIGRKTLSAMLSGGECAEVIYNMSDAEIVRYLREQCRFSQGIAGRIGRNIMQSREKTDADSLWQSMERDGIRFVMPGQSEYPVRLEEIPDAPIGLYIKGKEDFAAFVDKNYPVVAVVGARNCSEYGKYVAKKLGQKCAERGIVLVSGMAYGIDAIAQWSCLGAGGKVCAVFGCGVDVCYPEMNRPIYDALCEAGCMYSEYIPGARPSAGCFPPRNRIISGMADALIVVEAKEKSGTLITVDMALEQGKDVYVVPGRVTDPMSVGCNRLIRQGACPVCDLDVLLEEIKGGDCCKVVQKKDVDEASMKDMRKGGCGRYPEGSVKSFVYAVLGLNPMSVQQIYDTIAQQCKTDVVAVQKELLYMQMEGVVYEECGRYGLVAQNG